MVTEAKVLDLPAAPAEPTPPVGATFAPTRAAKAALRALLVEIATHAAAVEKARGEAFEVIREECTRVGAPALGWDAQRELLVVPAPPPEGPSGPAPA